MGRPRLSAAPARLLSLAAVAARARLGAALASAELVRELGPVPADAPPRLRCIVEGMGSCLAPEGSTAGAEQVPGGARCLSVGLEQCQQRRGEWLGPRLPPQWQRLKGSLSPCYADGPGGRVRCLPLVLNLAPSKSGTEDLYKRLLAHPAVVKNDGIGSTNYEGFYASKEPTFWTHAEVDNYTLEDFARAYDQLAITVADMAKVQGQPRPTSSKLLNFMKMFRKKRRRELAGIANAVGIDFSAVTMDGELRCKRHGQEHQQMGEVEARRRFDATP
ncbi:unnamed protein product [Prorocentrum cordatum]|uniref:Uncharacterized protein n=1 Tax=Prorocentrum cordatum TaxID=2364126 RepID=A0ABN9XJ84_9DINO|nr:unnamed protein product [Polarella glacialis]